MVHTNCGIPDGIKSNGSDEVTPNRDLVLPNTDSETDDEVESFHGGYELLRMNDFIDDNESSSSNSETENNSEVNNAVGINLPEIVPVDVELVKAIWSCPAPKEVDIKMDSEKVNEVKQAMLNITLPSSSIPDWALNISEDEWKEQLLNRLQNSKT